MSCHELTDRLHDYQRGDVDRADLRAIEDHLKVCDRCLRYACEYERTLRLARSAAGNEA